jgi:hypothetical protein
MRTLPLLALLILAACTPQQPWQTQTSAYTPVLMGRNGMKNAIEVMPPRDIVNSGKIYVYNDWLFVNERFEGIHVINNTDPTNPLPMHFIRIPGNIDVAYKNGRFYADQATDLLVLSYDGNTLTELQREAKIFMPLAPPDGLPYNPPTAIPDSLVIIKWTKE